MSFNTKEAAQILHVPLHVQIRHPLHDLRADTQLPVVSLWVFLGSDDADSHELADCGLVQWPVSEIPGKETFRQLSHYFLPR